MPKKYAHINFAPPQDVQAAARRGLALRRKYGRGGLSRKEASAQGIGSGVQRATNLANGDKVSPETIGRMVSFFARHEKNKDSKTPSGEPGAGQIAWLLWGGTPGQRWAMKVKHQMEAADMQNKSLATLARQILTIRGAMGSEAHNGNPLPLVGSYDLPAPLTYKSGGNTGAMIALFLSTGAGVRFVQSDPGAVPLNELHITLAYLGKADDLSFGQIKEAHGLMRLISENHPPLTGHINGCGRFCNGDDDGDPFFIIPDLPALPNLRQAIIDGLKGHGTEGASDHGFVPHITLTYLPHAEYNPFDILEKTPITFGVISLVLGDERYDYPLVQGVPLLSKAALIEKIGARHTGVECALIQKMHDLTLDLGAECHPLTRRAGARHSHADQGLVQRIHDDCAGLGAVCKGMPEKDKVYSSQILKEGEIIKAQSDAPNYAPASTPQRCANCRFFLGDPGRDWCDLFDFTADQDYHCDAWEAQRPDEIPGYIANKGDLAALTEGVLALRSPPKLT
jgi:2'-5' RNA ligase